MKAQIVFLCLLVLGVTANAAEPAKFELSSGVFKQDGEIPKKYTCQGSDINPPLEIKNIPHKTKSLALTVHDPDAQEGVWVHWVVYDIPPTVTEIKENVVPGYQALNDFGKYNFSGPCATDERLHHYVFRAYALDGIFLINEGMTMKDLEKEMKGHIIAKSELTGTYTRPIW